MKFEENGDTRELRRCPKCNGLNTRFVGKPNNKKKVCNACGYDEREIE